MFWYAIASLTPAALLALACLLGGLWPLAALLSITVVVFFMDKLGKVLAGTEQTGRGLSLTLGAVHFALLALVGHARGTDGHGGVDKVLIFTAAGLFFGQISNSNAHELIHAGARLPRRLGAAIYASLLHGHHVSAHLRVHHVHAATDADPNSARSGEGFWAFAARAVRGEFIAGLRAEHRHRARAAARPPAWTHPYVGYLGGAALTAFCAYALAGIGGILALLGVVVYAQLQLLLSDYVQHYGLRRRMRGDKPEPVGPQHSWNAPKWYSSAMMLNAPRHSDHHMRPTIAFPALEVRAGKMPVLPHSLPVMAVIALIPPLWRRLMDRRVAKWRETG